jgi:hypothetical protein
LAELTESVVFSLLLLNFNLAAFRSHNLRPTSIAGYLSCHAHSQTFVRVLGRPKLLAIRSPNQECEDFLWVGLVKIYKRWLAFRTLRVMRADYLAAYCGPIADMILGFGGAERLGLGMKARIYQETKRQYDN